MLRFTLRHHPAGTIRIAVLAALSLFGCQGPPEEAATAVVNTALLAGGASCTANDQCSSRVCSGGVCVASPDLVVTSITGVPAQVSAQQLVPASWTVKNQGAAVALGSTVSCCAQTDHGSTQYNNRWFDRFFLSTDAALSTDDVFVGEYIRPDNFTLAASASYTASASIHVPVVAAGSYYLILVTDGYGNRVLENDETNNTLAIPVTVGQADLVATSLTGVPTQTSGQQLLPVSWTVKNQASSGAASGSLIPCCAQTDHGSSQYNNIWFDRFFLSTDAALSADDVFIAEYPRPDNFTLAAGASYTASASIHVPSVPPGSYYLIFTADGYGDRVPESDESNNAIAVPITVGPADLVVSALAGVPAQVSSQQLLPVSWTVKNQASSGAASGSLVPCCGQTDHGSYQYNNIWFDRFFLSTDATLSADDTFIAEYPRPDNFTLAAGTTYTGSASIHVPSVAAGSYYLIVITDGYGNRVPESDDSNNTFAIPVTVGQADLVVSAVTGVPAQVSSQQLLPVSWTVTNQASSGAASGSLVPCCAQTDHGSYQYNNIWLDRFFLSTDATLSADDTFIAEYPRPDNFTLAAGASYTANASIHVPSVAAGAYYLILVTDGYGNRVPESDDSNNTFAIPVTVGQADLVVASLTGVPAQVSSQQLLPVSWTVNNQAASGAASGSLVPCCAQTDHGSYQYNNIWFDRFFLSTDATLSTDDTFIAEFARPDNFTLAAGATYTANASIHVPSVAAGAYYLILVTDGFGNRVPESNEGNNTFAIPVTVGQADLVVASLTGVPEQAAAQQLLPVSWTVNNQAASGAASGSLVPCCAQTDHGSYQYNNLWFDRFFLSTDATLSANDTFIAEYARPDNFTLAAGASYTANASIQLPATALGNYYVILVTDGFGNRVPESDDTNNTIAIPITVGQADLVVSSLTGVPAQVSSQQLLPVSWNVTNQASFGAASGSLVPCCAQTDHGSYQYNHIWFDRFFLSTDAALSADDTFIAEYPRPDNFTLAAGAAYTASASIHVPTVTAGAYYVILVTDGYGNRVPESNDSNNTFAIPVTVGQADLVVSSVTGVPGQATAQQLLPVSWTVKNQASAGAASGSLVPCCAQTDHGSYQYNNLWFDRFFLSTDATLSTDDTFIAEFARPDNFTLAAGATYTANASIHVPSVAAGAYYLILVTDGYGNRVPESNEGNNTFAIPITVGQADLVVSSVTGVPAQVSSQQLLPVSWTVANQASSGAASGSLVPCCAQTDHGSYQYNNLWFDRFFLSTDATLSTDDTFIAEFARPDNFTLAAGATYTANASIHVPSVAAGAYYLILVTDGFGNRVPESNEGNNTFAIPVTVGQADLVVASLTGVPGQAAAQQLLPVSWTVKNQAASGAASGSLVPCCAQTDHGSYQYNNLWFDRFFLSTDATLSANDTFIAEYARPDNFTLAAGASYTANASIQLPAVTPGNYYVILVTDGFGNRVPETDDTNNTIAIPITMGQADLVVSSLTGVPAQTSSQQLLPVSWTVTNQASLGAASGSLVPCCAQTDHGSYQYNHIWFDRFFLSTDAALSADDTFIAEYPRPDGFTLASGASYTATASIQVPTVAAGSYYIILITDGFGNRVPESNDDNNVVAVPITVGQADLVVASVTGVPAQASVQQLLPVSWTVTNQAPTGAASGSLVPCCAQTDHGSYQYNHIWFDRLFLSTDATLSADDVFIGESARPDNFTLAAGASYTASATVHVPTVAVGSYYLILVTDGYGNRVPESDDSNNTLSVPITVGQADLAATAVTGIPAQVSSQQLVPIAWTVTNQAATGAASGSLVPCCAQTDHGSYQYNNVWFDRFFVSTDATLSADDTFLGEYARPDGFRLAAGASYTATAILQMPDLPAGSYYLIFAADAYGDRVPESNEANNTFAVPFSTLGRPDLLAVSLAGAPAQASSQQPLQLTWTVKNQATGGEASGSYVPCCAQTDHGSSQYNQRWFDRIFLSTDATLSANDTFLGEYARPDRFSLAGGASYSAAATIPWPRVPAGSYYLIFTTDGYGNRVPETDETNNTVVVPITGVTNSDLVVSNLSAPSGALGNKQFAAVSWTVTNGGTGTAWHSWQDKIYVSQNPVFDSTAIYVDFVSHDSDLPAGASYNVTKDVTLPDLTTGSYYFIVVTDASDAIAETNETNNGAVSAAPVTVRPTALVQPAVTLALPSGASRTTRSPVFSPDGTRLAIADGNRADLWSLDTLESTGSFTGHTNAVASVQFSPLGDQVLSASLDGTLKTWDPADLSQKGVLHQSNYYNPAVFSSDGTRIIAGSNSNSGVANLWDAQRSALLGSFVAGYNVTAVALSPNGSVAVTGGDGGGATLWSVATFTQIAQLRGHTDTVNAVAFSPDGSEFLTASNDGSIRFWGSATGASLGTIVQGRHVVDARYSGDGQYIVSCDDYAPGHTTQNTQAYLFTRGGLLTTVFQPQGWVDGVSATLGGIRPGFTGVALSPDSTTLATTYKTNSTDPVAGVFLWKTGLPAIPIVPAVPVALASSHPFTIQPGGRYLFEFTVADGQSGLVIHLSGTAQSATYPSTAGPDPVAVQMYLSQSGMPSPTSHLDAADVRSSALGGNLLASPTVGGTYRVLVTAPSLSGGSISAEISANYSGFLLSSVDGNKVGNAGRATFRVRGIQLTTAIGLVSPSSRTLAPVAVSYQDPTRVFATFDLTGAPVGSYDLQTTSGSTTLTLAGAVTVTTGTGPALSFSLQAPPAIRKNRAYDYSVTYVNNGDSDAVAPFVSVTPAEDGALFYSDGTHRPGSGIWLAGGEGWPSAVIPAGASGIIRFRASWRTTAKVTVRQLPEDSTPFDWTQILSNLPPATTPQGWTQAQAVMGSTYGQVLTHMRGIAAIGIGPVDFTRVTLASLLVSLQGNKF